MQRKTSINQQILNQYFWITQKQQRLSSQEALQILQRYDYHEILLNQIKKYYKIDQPQYLLKSQSETEFILARLQHKQKITRREAQYLVKYLIREQSQQEIIKLRIYLILQKCDPIMLNQVYLQNFKENKLRIQIVLGYIKNFYNWQGQFQNSKQFRNLINDNLITDKFKYAFEIVNLIYKFENSTKKNELKKLNNNLNRISKYCCLIREIQEGNKYKSIKNLKIEQFFEDSQIGTFGWIKIQNILYTIISSALQIKSEKVKYRYLKHLIKKLNSQKIFKIVDYLPLNQLFHEALLQKNGYQKKIHNYSVLFINHFISFNKFTIRQFLDKYKWISFDKNPKIFLDLHVLRKELLSFETLNQLFHNCEIKQIMKYLNLIYQKLDDQKLLSIFQKILYQQVHGYSQQYPEMFNKILEIYTNQYKSFQLKVDNHNILLLYFAKNSRDYLFQTNNQIAQLYRSSYPSQQNIVSLFIHLNNIIYLQKQRQLLKINVKSLSLIENLIINKKLGCIIQKFDFVKYYKIIGLIQNQKLIDHLELILEQSDNEYQLIIIIIRQIIANINLKNIDQNKIQHYVNSRKWSKTFIISVCEVILLTDLKKINNQIYQQVSKNIYHYFLINPQIMLQFSIRYQIKIVLDKKLLERINPSHKLIYFLKRNQQYSRLYEELKYESWQYYKFQLNTEIKRLYYQKSPIKIFPICFRGDLFNEKPLLFQFLTPYHFQNYFMNYSVFMSLFYADIFCDAVDEKFRIQTIGKIYQDIKLYYTSTEQKLDERYFRNLNLWKIFVLVCHKLLKSSDISFIKQIKNFLFELLLNKNLPNLRQYIELLLEKILELIPVLQDEFIEKLVNETSVNVCAPLVLILGYHMVEKNSQKLFIVLMRYVSSHTAYVRGLCQYYCYEFIQKNKFEDTFLKTLLNYSLNNKDTKKLMKNIGLGIQKFKEIVKELNIKSLMTTNFEKGQNLFITQQTYSQLKNQLIKFLKQILPQCHEQLKPKILNYLISNPQRNDIKQPNFLQYQQQHHKEFQLIVVASLLQKFPNFGHLVRTCTQYPNTTLVIPTKNILNESEYLDIIPENSDINIIEVKKKDLIQFLLVQKQRGYKIVALQQASRSIQIQKFQFPKKTVLVLGNQRLGMGSEIIQLADHLVEIQQYGRVRSLNVHISSVVFFWSYYKNLIMS